MLKKNPFILIIWCFAFLLLLIGFLAGPIRNQFSFLTDLFFSKDINLKRTDGSINILVLGIGGGKHDGPDLSDTIILANIKPEKKEVNLISIPRDLWVPDLNSKINQAYSNGQEKGEKGILLSSAVVENVTGQPVNYTFVLDFQGFEKLIDVLGGVTVDVKNSFDDYQYPIVGKENELCGNKQEDVSSLLATASSELDVFPCRYEHLHFDKGKQMMNGEKALMCVRSRHAQGEEGTDFARSARQHQVIVAVKDKLFSLGTISNPIKVFGIYNTLKDNINTDIKLSELNSFIKLASNLQNAKINNFVIDIGDEGKSRFGLLINPPITEEYKFQWVLIPRIGNNDFSEIKKYLKCINEKENCIITENGVNPN